MIRLKSVKKATRTNSSSFLSRYKLIRRRVIWLIGQWISVKFKSDLRPLLYEVILSLMQDPDLVVRHTHTKSVLLIMTEVPLSPEKSELVMTEIGR